MSVIIPDRLKRRLDDGPIIGAVPAVVERNGERVMTVIPQPRAARANTSGGMDWNDDGGAKEGSIPVPASEIERIRSSAAPIIRREATEKYRELVGRLFRDAQTQFYRDGRVKWPASVEREIAVIGAAQGNTTIVQQVEELAGRFITRAARQQQAQNRRSVTTDYHGHLSA